MFKQQIEQMALIKNSTESLDTSHIHCTLSYINSVSSLGSRYANLADEVKRGNVLVIQHPRLERQDALLRIAGFSNNSNPSGNTAFTPVIRSSRVAPGCLQGREEIQRLG